MSKSSNPLPEPDETWEKYSLSSRVIFWNKVMSLVVSAGGVFLIVCVSGILLFIFSQVLPLARGARASQISDFSLPVSDVMVADFSADGKHFWVLGGEGDFFWRDRSASVWSKMRAPWAESAVNVFWNSQQQMFFVTEGGNSFGGFVLHWQEKGPQFLEADRVRLVLPDIFIEQGFEIADISSAGNSERKTTALLLRNQSGVTQIYSGLQKQRRTLLGGESWSEPKWVKTGTDDVRYLKILVPRTGDSLIALRADGTVDYFLANSSGNFELRQSFIALKNNVPVTACAFAFGDVSIIVGGAGGELRRWSLARPEKTTNREFILTGEWEPLDGGVKFLAGNQRNKSVLIAGGKEARILNSTTGALRWLLRLSEEISSAAWDAAAQTVALCTANGGCFTYLLDDAHPESGVRAFFGPVWYEGRARAEYVWQSTSGTDDFEPKFSLVPLIIGSLKGVFYSLLFAIPLALTGALYVSQIMRPFARGIIKPTMEWMASFPSVVLGFVGALWIAPLLAPKIPSLMFAVAGVPVCVALAAYLWAKAARGRAGIWSGREWILLLPLVLFTGFVLWQLGPLLEKFVFKIPDAPGQADFRMWWREVVGLSFEQRNAFVVGLMMGFAVIPVIFSIADDAFTNVPTSLKLGAEALGASRWQVAWKIVWPVAFSGVFSAIMVGMGRAIGETMIVVMVSGNTAILDWNPFSGMRPLSANIAVELPEAARDTTHYRVLFLSALVLFLICFVLNTAAEFVRERFRRRMKAL
jgi:phosphate transport system permease protein